MIIFWTVAYKIGTSRASAARPWDYHCVKCFMKPSKLPIKKVARRVILKYQYDGSKRYNFALTGCFSVCYFQLFFVIFSKYKFAKADGLISFMGFSLTLRILQVIYYCSLRYSPFLCVSLYFFLVMHIIFCPSVNTLHWLKYTFKVYLVAGGCTYYAYTTFL